MGEGKQAEGPSGGLHQLCQCSAHSLFESGINWGRVVALLGFGYRLALHVYQRGLTGFLGQVTRFVADFMLRRCIARWIAQRGGWVSAQGLAASPLLLGCPSPSPTPVPGCLHTLPASL